jgi:hypothetical protein
VNVFQTAIQFIQTEIKNPKELLNEILCGGCSFSGSTKFDITKNINNFINTLEFLKQNFDKNLIKQFLLDKNSQKQNFLLCNDDYSDPANSHRLKRFLESMFSIFENDSELFNELFLATDSKGNCFNKKLFGKYKYEINNLEIIKSWIKSNLGESFLKSLEWSS